MALVTELEQLTVGQHLRAAKRLVAERIAATVRPQSLLAAVLAVVVTSAAWTLPETLSPNGRMTLVVTALCVIGWTLTKLPDLGVALAAILVLVLFGGLPAGIVYASLGSEVVWLLIASFLVATVLKGSGLVERVVGGLLAPFKRVSTLFHALTLAIALTAFLIPSTSGRAALLLPMFLALVERLPDPRLVRPLALLFPSVILLSAGGALTGAGAHVVAIDVLAQRTGLTISPFQWILLALPVSLAASFAATFLILGLFVPADLRKAALAADTAPSRPFDRRQLIIASVVVAMVLAWFTTGWHGIDIGLVAVVGATVLMSKLTTDKKPKELMKSVELDLIMFLAVTAALAQAMSASGVDRWMAAGIVEALPTAAVRSTPVVVALAAVIALLSHIVINSRSARAAVLIPIVALPLIGLGHDPVPIVMVTVLGTGFCQTLMASAKPVAIFGQQDRPTFGQKDLIRLALPLLPIKFALLVAAALFVWPHQAPTSASGTQGPALGAPAVAHAASNVKDPVSKTVSPEASDVAAAAIPAVPSCGEAELRTLIIATIRDRRMWASGWWHVWKRLTKDGVSTDRKTVKRIYRNDDLVRLRRASPELSNLDDTVVADAFRICRGR